MVTVPPTTRWNIFARELEDILASRGYWLNLIDDRIRSIHHEKVRRLIQSLQEPNHFPVLMPWDIQEVILEFSFTSEDIIRLQAALFVTAIQRKLMKQRRNQDDVLLIAEALLPLLREAVLTTRIVTFGGHPARVASVSVQRGWNIFARELEEILARHHISLRHLEHLIVLHPMKGKRLIDSLRRPTSFPTFNEAEMARLAIVFGLRREEIVRLQAAFLATAIEELLMSHISPEQALVAAERLLPALEQAILTLGSRILPKVIDAWLEEKRSRTHAERTVTTYRETLTHFRAFLLLMGQDLNSDPEILAKAASQ